MLNYLEKAKKHLSLFLIYLLLLGFIFFPLVQDDEVVFAYNLNNLCRVAVGEQLVQKDQHPNILFQKANL